MRQRLGVNAVVVDQVLVQLVGVREPQFALRALAHAATLASGLLALLLALAGPLVATSVAQGADPMRPQQWHLDKVHAADAWRAHRGQGVVVAVVDTGVDATHPDLAGRVRGGVDLVDEGTPPADPNGHGTLVAGVLAAVAGNGVGVAGAAPEVSVLPVRVLDDEGQGDANRVARGIRWAVDNGAQVINLSLAEVPGLLSDLAGLMGSELEDAIRYAEQRGALVVAAAGNDGRSSTPYPADLPVVVVGATDQADRVWQHSNRDRRTLFAPGVDILATWRAHGYGKGTGTSFATPVVAGAAAILLGQGHSRDEVRRRLEQTAVAMGSGHGRVDFAAAAGVEPAPATSPSPTSSAGPPPATAPPESPPPSHPPPSDQPDSPDAPPTGQTDTQPGGVVAVATPTPEPTTAPAEPITVEEQDGASGGLETVMPGGDAQWIGWLVLVSIVGLFGRAALRR